MKGKPSQKRKDSAKHRKLTKQTYRNKKTQAIRVPPNAATPAPTLPMKRSFNEIEKPRKRRKTKKKKKFLVFNE